MNFLRHHPYRIVLAGIIGVILIAGGTYTALHVIKGPRSEQATPQTQAPGTTKAETLVQSAAKNEQAGKTDAALGNYKDALKAYEEAGDQAGMSGVAMQIEYLEKVREEERKRAAGELPTELDERLPVEYDDPSSMPTKK